ncbi:MAG: MarR family transcriptional regulator [Polyangiaceae bacterium]
MNPTLAGPKDEVFEFMRVVWALHHAMAQTSKRMQRELGVTGPQRLVLRVVAGSPGCTAGEIASALHLHPSTLTGVLRRLEENRMIVRQADAEDGRRFRFSLAPRGKRAVERRVGTVEAAMRAALVDASPKERAAAERLLKAMSRALGGATNVVSSRA